MSKLIWNTLFYMVWLPVCLILVGAVMLWAILITWYNTITSIRFKLIKDYTLTKFIFNCISYWSWKIWQFKGTLTILGVTIIIAIYLILRFKGML